MSSEDGESLELGALKGNGDLFNEFIGNGQCISGYGDSARKQLR